MTTLKDSLIVKTTDAYVDLQVPGQGPVRVYGNGVHCAAHGFLLHHDVLARTSSTGHHRFESSTVRPLRVGALFFKRLIKLLGVFDPKVVLSKVRALFEGWAQASDAAMYYTASILPKLLIWQHSVPDLRVWLHFQEYDYVFSYYRDELVYKASVEEIKHLASVIATANPTSFLRLALCGSCRSGWVTASLPMTPSADITPRLTSSIVSALHDAEPWFADASHESARAPALLVECGFLTHAAGAYRRATFEAKRAEFRSYASMRTLPPYRTVSDMVEDIHTMVLGYQDSASPMPVVVRLAGAVFHPSSLDCVEHRSFTVMTHTQFLARYDGACDVIVYLADQWTFTDLCALTKKMAGGSLILTCTGRAKNAAGYSVFHSLYSDFSPAQLIVDPAVTADGNYFRKGVYYRLPRVLGIRASLDKVMRKRTHYPWIFVADDVAEVAELSACLDDVFGLPWESSSTMLQFKGGSYDGLVSRVVRYCDVPCAAVGEKRKNGKKVKSWNSPCAFKGGVSVDRMAYLGKVSKLVGVKIEPGVVLEPKRIFTIDEAYGCNGCGMIYFGKLGEDGVRALISVAKVFVHVSPDEVNAISF